MCSRRKDIKQFQGFFKKSMAHSSERVHSHFAGRMRSLCKAAAASTFTALIGLPKAHGAWSTADLSVPRSYLTATSVGNIAIFAGGMHECASS
jgi:hypothetical protein